MNKIKTYLKFLFEKRDSGINKQIEAAQDLLEEWVASEACVAMLGGEANYEWPDSDSDGMDYTVWIDCRVNTETYDKIQEQLDNNYEEFIAPYVEWAKQKGLYNPEIMSNSDNPSISFNCTIIGEE